MFVWTGETQRRLQSSWTTVPWQQRLCARRHGKHAWSVGSGDQTISTWWELKRTSASCDAW